MSRLEQKQRVRRGMEKETNTSRRWEEERSEEYTGKFGRGHSEHEYPPKAGKFRNLSST